MRSGFVIQLLNSFEGECDEALMWNYRDNTWSIRDLNDVRSGDYAPIHGGGSPGLLTTFFDEGSDPQTTTFMSGNTGQLNDGRAEIQTLTTTGQIRAPHQGIQQIQTYEVPTSATFTADRNAGVDIAFTGRFRTSSCKCCYYIPILCWFTT